MLIEDTPRDITSIPFAHHGTPALLTPAERGARTAEAPFGSVFTEHMVSLKWTGTDGWHDGEVGPYAPLVLDPAAVGLHYGQSVFEGLKAYRTADGRTAVFRPHAHGDRFRRSAARLLMPELPTQTFVHAVEELVRADAAWVPAEEHRSLYLRPLLFASEAHLALRPAREFRFLLIAFVTERFFGAPRPITVWISEDYARATPGGTGAAKFGGNYAASYAAQARATAEGCDQVVWLDAQERRWVEELGGMNIFFVEGTGAQRRLVTPPLSGTILPGVTRDTILSAAPELGLPVEERPVSVEQWREGCRQGRITEVFACGTAAQVSSVGTVRTADGDFTVGDGSPGPVAGMISDLLAGIERGLAPDPAGWMHYV
ncbi:branched-chain-amino-acid aminotransferase [Streptomyces spiroverticillatus]|uniref:Branched-chain-amino-acid aminotransferase n=1 Tax=Streptomyces finlayi TaxID=67296 RepID=A0A918WYH3_9ACTN|nr:branched-chain amino acid aminotransferase [Streptomyces finlayi]GHA11535.1 branched-chain-amino-acid aminotransferase [Streptomyces spiroverticillatus]GHC94958.1 branched-chain-amino-acid aminotransferase [Streptomyces finlayi]